MIFRIGVCGFVGTARKFEVLKKSGPRFIASENRGPSCELVPATLLVGLMPEEHHSTMGLRLGDGAPDPAETLFFNRDRWGTLRKPCKIMRIPEGTPTNPC
jgi:hypothetical protein